METGEAALARAQAHHAVRLQRPAGLARRLSGARKGTALSRAPQWLRNIPARPSCGDAVYKALETPRRAGGGRLRGLRPSAAGRSFPPSPGVSLELGTQAVTRENAASSHPNSAPGRRQEGKPGLSGEPFSLGAAARAFGLGWPGGRLSGGGAGRAAGTGPISPASLPRFGVTTFGLRSHAGGRISPGIGVILCAIYLNPEVPRKSIMNVHIYNLLVNLIERGSPRVLRGVK